MDNIDNEELKLKEIVERQETELSDLPRMQRIYERFIKINYNNHT